MQQGKILYTMYVAQCMYEDPKHVGKGVLRVLHSHAPCFDLHAAVLVGFWEMVLLCVFLAFHSHGLECLSFSVELPHWIHGLKVTGTHDLPLIAPFLSVSIQ